MSDETVHKVHVHLTRENPPVRQAHTVIGLEGSTSRLSDLAGARQPVARDGKAVAQRASGLVLCQSQIHHDTCQAASSNWA